MSFSMTVINIFPSSFLWKKGSCESRYSTLNQMNFKVPQKINDGKMLALVKLIIVNCNFSLPQENSRRLCRKQNG